MTLELSNALQHATFCIVPQTQRLISEGWSNLAFRCQRKHIILLLAQHVKGLCLRCINLGAQLLLYRLQLLELVLVLR